MPLPPPTSRLIDRVLRQRRWVSLFHGAAIFLVPLVYWAGNLEPLPTGHELPRAWLAKEAIEETFLGWAPIAISWLLTRDPFEENFKFRAWKVLFATINVGACAAYLGLLPAAWPTSMLIWAAVHALLLVAIAPLATSPE